MNPLDLICHRKPERSFFFRGHQFPVCARCTGFYISGIASIFLVKVFVLPIDIATLLFGIILLAPAALDGTTQLFKMRESNNTLRFITGLLGGVGLIICYDILIRIILEYYF
ncbi:DUF2085 domain-containing protein [uncultured Methanobrevibacter sp.]|uniref:DUF2085 domain-containing protein n=1 Tax=uncultured Methanobrevibacter sp. TaxID=253161 RepID=UPI00262650B4